jgi:tetrahydromethanopterin S-methyltransferase subunit D
MLVVIFSILIGLAGIGSIILGVLQPLFYYLSSTNDRFPGGPTTPPQVTSIYQAAANLNMVFSILNIIVAPMLVWGGIKCYYKKKYSYLANVVVAAAVYVLVRYVVRLICVGFPLQKISLEGISKPLCDVD